MCVLPTREYERIYYSNRHRHRHHRYHYILVDSSIRPLCQSIENVEHHGKKQEQGRDLLSLEKGIQNTIGRTNRTHSSNGKKDGSLIGYMLQMKRE